jgi:phenylpyruvate tautomerase PptA (4-oxalocrotonate tautomerase family)
VTLPEGALSERRRAELVTEATRVVAQVAELEEEDTLRVWVVVCEIPDGRWGAGGNLIDFEALRGIVSSARVA